MVKIISVALQKGGVGKSTTSQALASTLGFKKKKVLLIDLDSQGNTTFASGVKTNKTIFDVFNEDCSTEQAIVKAKYYDLLGADGRLSVVENGKVEPTLLKSSLAAVKDNYDFIVIDTPPSLGNLLVNALTVSDFVIIPTEPRPFAIQGINELHKTITQVQNRLNKSLKVLGILLIKYSNRIVLNKNLKDMIDKQAEAMNTVVFEATIREGIAVAEAQTVRQPLIDYAKSSKPNIDYKGFTNEVLKMIGE